MPTLLENGGVVDLWAGWSTTLSASSYHQRNEDGSWSAWGVNWAIDTTIIEFSEKASTAFGNTVGLPKAEHETEISGNGWSGTKRVFTDSDDARTVFRLAATMSAAETIMLFYVSYLSEEQSEFAEGLLRGVIHRAPSGA